MLARLTASLLLVISVLLPADLFAAGFPHYRVGDVATSDIVTPVPLVVEDEVATALLKEKQEREARVIVRYCPSLANDAERAMRSHMALLREAFVKELALLYLTNQVDKSVEHTPKFMELTDRFRKEHDETPKLFRYMPYWAQARSDEHLLSDWAGYIRRAMDQPIRPDRLDLGNIGSTVCLVTVPDLDVRVQVEHAERYGVLTPLNNIVSLTEAGSSTKSSMCSSASFTSTSVNTWSLKPLSRTVTV